MTTLRKMIVYVFLAVFVVAFLLAVLGSLRRIAMPEGALTGFFVILVVQGIAAIVAAFRTPDFFKEEPKTISEIERRHAGEVAQLRKEISDMKVEKVTAAAKKDDDEKEAASTADFRRRFPLAVVPPARDDEGKK